MARHAFLAQTHISAGLVTTQAVYRLVRPGQRKRRVIKGRRFPGDRSMAPGAIRRVVAHTVIRIDRRIVILLMTP